ncbi:MAG: tryptophan/tyrosine permease [Deltaproteobacteria bacterium]|nr:tryptophan/tyrosine permease [Deltaproteobacteria bacterium]
MKETSKLSLILSMSFVVTGNMLGAGILALPIKTGLSGFIPSVLGILLMWALMLSTAMILAGQKSLTESKTADLPTFFQKELGTVGKWITVVANMIILYGLLVAYISGTESVVQGLFTKPVSTPLVMICFFLVATFLTLFGMKLMRKGNAVIMILMWVTFGTLVFYCAQHVETPRLRFTDWQYLPASLPVVVTAFHFHNIIPSICRNMDFDQRAIRKAMFLGTFIGLIMNLIWVCVVIAALPLDGPGTDTVLAAFHGNQPATVPLSHLLESRAFTISALVFALLAMTAAYMANGTALTSFIRDLTTTYLHTSSRAVAAAVAFLPPLIISLVYPNVFLDAIGLVGGVGIDLIFGILPGWLLIKYGRGKVRVLGYVIVACFSVVLIYELGQELGLLHIRPHVEYWNVSHKSIVPH